MPGTVTAGSTSGPIQDVCCDKETAYTWSYASAFPNGVEDPCTHNNAGYCKSMKRWCRDYRVGRVDPETVCDDGVRCCEADGSGKSTEVETYSGDGFKVWCENESVANLYCSYVCHNDPNCFNPTYNRDGYVLGGGAGGEINSIQMRCRVTSMFVTHSPSAYCILAVLICI